MKVTPKLYTTQQVSRHLVNHNVHSARNTGQSQNKTREQDPIVDYKDNDYGNESAEENTKDTEDEKSGKYPFIV